MRWPYKSGDLVAPQPAETVISDITEIGMRQHWTRNLAFSPDGKWLYVTIGSDGSLLITDDWAGSSLPSPLQSSRQHRRPEEDQQFERRRARFSVRVSSRTKTQ